MLCLVRYLQKEMERYCYHVCHLRNVFPKLVCYLPKIMYICYCTKCTVISLTHNFETFFCQTQQPSSKISSRSVSVSPYVCLPVCCLVSCLTICLFKGVRFGRNCGAVSVKKYNKIQLTIWSVCPSSERIVCLSVSLPAYLSFFLFYLSVCLSVLLCIIFWKVTTRHADKCKTKSSLTRIDFADCVSLRDFFIKGSETRVGNWTVCLEVYVKDVTVAVNAPGILIIAASHC